MNNTHYTLYKGQNFEFNVRRPVCVMQQKGHHVQRLRAVKNWRHSGLIIRLLYVFSNYIWNVQSLSKLHSFWSCAMTAYKGTASPADKHQFQHNGKNICWDENKCSIVFVSTPLLADNAMPTIWTMDETFHLGCRWRSSLACAVWGRGCLKAICWVWEHNHWWWCCNI